MWLGTRLECVGSSSRVSGACQDGAREFAGRRPRLTKRLSGVVEPPRTAGKSPVPRRRMLVCLKEEDLGVDVGRLMSNHYKTTEKLLDRFGVPKHSAPVDFAVPPPRQRNLVV
ncbi:hypothetical protein GW17_00017350 [Ensete ventricosum]|nr:hypothetical protein GW17_00017350 [Ensete ventricosum]